MSPHLAKLYAARSRNYGLAAVAVRDYLIVLIALAERRERAR